MTKPYRKLKEFSVVYTDRSLNHMSDEFIDVMKDISAILKEAYNADLANGIGNLASRVMTLAERNLEQPVELPVEVELGPSQSPELHPGSDRIDRKSVV